MISILIFFESNLFVCRSSYHGNDESLLVDSTIEMDIIKDVRAEIIHVCLAFNISLVLDFQDMILVLLFLGCGIELDSGWLLRDHALYII
jgi:hypothetical protein